MLSGVDRWCEQVFDLIVPLRAFVDMRRAQKAEREKIERHQPSRAKSCP